VTIVVHSEGAAGRIRPAAAGSPAVASAPRSNTPRSDAVRTGSGAAVPVPAVTDAFRLCEPDFASALAGPRAEAPARNAL